MVAPAVTMTLTMTMTMMLTVRDEESQESPLAPLSWGRVASLKKVGAPPQRARSPHRADGSNGRAGLPREPGHMRAAARTWFGCWAKRRPSGRAPSHSEAALDRAPRASVVGRPAPIAAKA